MKKGIRLNGGKMKGSRWRERKVKVKGRGRLTRRGKEDRSKRWKEGVKQRGGRGNKEKEVDDEK